VAPTTVTSRALVARHARNVSRDELCNMLESVSVSGRAWFRLGERCVRW
jgi:hypothetical protein